MRITIRAITLTGESHTFRTAGKCMKFLNGNKCDEYYLNNEPATFVDVFELHQLELAERRHNRRQGL